MTVSYPNQHRNYCVFNQERVNSRKNLDEVKTSLQNPKSEDEVVEDLYILNCMLDEGTPAESVAELYPELSKYNQTNSPNVQTYLAGIYRKTKVPDAFGPLVAMLIRNSINQKNHNSVPFTPHFDPNEEIGGAILDYLA